MKKQILNFSTKLFGTFLMIISFSSCNKDLENQALPTSYEPNGSEELTVRGGNNDLALYTLNVDRFAAGIEAALAGKLSGYGYSIINNGIEYHRGVGGSGWNRRPVDAPALAHGAIERQGLASSTKYAVALLVARILEKNGKTMNELIYKYLPSNWNPHPDFKTITFGDLLAHKAGIIKYGNTYFDVKKTVEGGVIKANQGVRVYDNMNYFMCHYLVPYMIGKMESPGLLNLLDSKKYYPSELVPMIDVNFRYYFRLYVCKPAGLTYWDKVDFAPWNATGTIPLEDGCRFYNTLNINEKGTIPGNGLSGSGPGGLYISAVEYGQIINAAAHGKIISKALYYNMKVELRGFDWALSGKFGPYYAKNGKARSEEMLIDFGSTQVIVIANCDFGGLSGTPSWIVNAFDAAAN
ncbi:MAG: serine hydrolase [Saprospiraceae bacterium]